MPSGEGGGVGGPAPHHHRSTLTQQNKPFKSRHASKGSIKSAAKGRRESTTSNATSASRASSHRSNPFTAPPSIAGASAGSAAARRNLAKQIQRNKRAALVKGTRVFSSSSSAAAVTALASPDSLGDGLGKGIAARGGGAPRIVAVCSLADDVDAWEAVRIVETQEGEQGGVTPVRGKGYDDARQGKALPFVELDLTRHRTTLQLLPLPYGALFPMLDACRCADFVLLLLSATSSIEPGSWGELALRSLQAQGLSNVVVAVPSLGETVGAGGSRKPGAVQRAAADARKSLLSFARYFAPDVERVYALDERAERGALLRSLATTTPRRVAWRDFRSSLVAESASWQLTQDAEADTDAVASTSVSADAPRGTLRLRGWIRGAPISANRLVHLPDFGDFRVRRIVAAPPAAASASRTGRKQSQAAAAVVVADMSGAAAGEQSRAGAGGVGGGGPSEATTMDVDMAEGGAEGQSGRATTQQQQQPNLTTTPRHSLVEGELLDELDEEVADDLVSEAEVDELDQEQTWPTADEEKGLGSERGGAAATADVPPPAAVGTTPRSILKNGNGSAGTRAAKAGAGGKRYQATWLDDGEDDDEDVDIDGMSEKDGADDGGEAAASEDDDEDDRHAWEEDSADLRQFSDEETRGGGKGARNGRGVERDGGDEEEEDDAEMAAYRELLESERERRRREADEADFPDEVDTPMHVAARVRFARYRGLRSLRSSGWDPYEELPRDYARIFQFDDYARTRRRVEAASLQEGVAPGTRVELQLEKVPIEAARLAGAEVEDSMQQQQPRQPPSRRQRLPFVVFGLLRHEHKMSVVNFTVARNTEYDGTVKSKDPLLLCLGPRRFRINPIFSQHDLGNTGRAGTNDVHRFERYLRGGNAGATSCATAFAPITFGGANVPAVLYRERSEVGERGYDQRGVSAHQMPLLVGSGTLLGAQPTRVNVKRIVLSGHPFKVHRRTATIRFMFFNPEDVRYFAPLELRTKLGRSGHIKEPLGTHGRFKAHFDAELSQLDTVLLSLYKRVYPKWTTKRFDAGYAALPLGSLEAPSGDDAMEAEGDD